jgi:HK97 gp10 family phage protein
MGSPVTVKIQGLEELSQKIHEFPDNLLKKGVRNALRAGGEVLRQAISSRAPRSVDETHGHTPGFLADHIGTVVKTSPKNDTGSIQVGPVKKAFYGMFAEFGTKHQPARPFVRPAFEGSAQDALDAFVAKLREAFDEVSR